MIRRLLLTLAAVLALAAPAAAEVNVKLRLLETADIHVHVLNYDYYRDREDDGFGLSRTATLIRQARAEVANSLLIDNGDSIQGNPLGDFVARVRGLKAGEVHPVYRVLNLLGYDAGNLGNHEFNYGLDFLGTSLAGVKHPVVSANIFHPDGQRNFFTPYVILDRKLKDETGAEHPIRIGVIGFVPPQIMQWDRVNLQDKVITKDIVDTAQLFVPEMRAKGADLVVAVPHSGINARERQGMDENAVYYLARVPGIDAILSGHAHLVFPSDTFKNIAGVDLAKGTIHGIPTAMPGFWGSHLGVIDMALKRDDAGEWHVADATASVRAVFRMEGRTRVAAVANDPEVVAAVTAEHEGTLAYVRAAVGKTSAPIYSYFALVQDDPSIQIVTDAQTHYIKTLLKGGQYESLAILSAGAPFKAGGRGGADYYTDIAAGDIAIKNVADLYLYPNTVQAVVVTGEGVREWLEMSAGIFNHIDPAKGDGQALVNTGFPSFNYDVIDGVTYKIDVTKPRRYDNDGKVIDAASRRIVDLRFKGQPIDPAQRFVVVTNNYRASGGGKFPGLDGKNIIVEAPEENREALVEYIRSLGTVNPSADGNWSFAAASPPVSVVFDSSPAAEKFLAAHPRVSKLGPGETGFTRYGLKLD
jgi:2',3'-cyclic-nucleotide 2'-phosphodiesterase/3'-nucleotidase